MSCRCSSVVGVSGPDGGKSQPSSSNSCTTVRAKLTKSAAPHPNPGGNHFRPSRPVGRAEEHGAGAAPRRSTQRSRPRRRRAAARPARTARTRCLHAAMCSVA
eukprot:7297117-Prymnesium_polylepis.2